MAKKSYNKLVRDNIPTLIQESGRKVEFIEITDLTKKLSLLSNKLVEEAQEYNKNKQVEEIADVLEVIYSILDLTEISIETIVKVRREKKQVKGGFEKSYLLLSVEEK